MWQTKRLGDILEKIEGGGTPSKDNRAYWGGKIPWASVKDIVAHNPADTVDHITEEGLRNSSSKLIPAGILITATRMALGHAVFFDVDVAINQDLKALYPKKGINKKYLYYWFQKNKRKIERLGSGSTVPGIQLGELRALPIDIPSEDEQKRIVRVLETWDYYIELLDRKIALKERLKKGLMQQLLTGKKRLPGFTGEWTNTKLGAIAKINMGQSPGSKNYNENGEGMVLIQGNADMKNGATIARIWTTEITKEAPAGSLIMTVRAPVGELGIASSDVCIGRGVCSIESDQLAFIKHYLTYFKSRWDKYIQGSTFESINGIDIRNLPISMPGKDESQEIAKILDLCDTEMATLKMKKDSLVKQKKYLLKNLISGTIRVPEVLELDKEKPQKEVVHA